MAALLRSYHFDHFNLRTISGNRDSSGRLSAVHLSFENQSSQQEDRDRYECHSWAVKQTGYDPSRTYPNNPAYLDPQPYQPSQRHVMRGAGRGAALGAVGGATTEDAGKGAAAGAAMGGLAGGFRRRDERRQQAAQQQANASAAVASQQVSYMRAMAACLEGRGYSVK